MLEYIFFRIYEQQLRIVKWRDEAALCAVLYMASGPQLAVLAVDMAMSSMLGVQSLAKMLGKWVFVVGTYVVSYWLHWFILVRNGRADEIQRTYSTRYQRSVRATVLAHLYFVLPAVIAIVVAGQTRPH